MTSPNRGIAIRCVRGEGNQLDFGRPERFPNPGCSLNGAGPVRPSEHFAHCEDARTESISTYFHSPANPIHSDRVLRMVFQPVHEQHAVPINTAHWSSAGAWPDS